MTEQDRYNIEMTEYLLKKSQTDVESSEAEPDYEFINLQVDQKQIIQRRNSSFHKVKSLFIDYTEKHELEQKFLMKLDFFLLSSATLGYLVKNLNQNNISTAYVNGMDEYYHMDQNQFNYLSTCWSIGYFIGQIISAYLLHLFPPRLFLGSLEIIWGLLTLCMVYSTTLNSVYILRFLIGLAESAFFPSTEYLLGSWYNSDELTKRSTLFALSSSFARIITGPIQVLILEWFNEDSKFKPFQYLFIFDVLVSIPIGLLTIIFNPDTPRTTKSWYWNSNDKLVALERVRRSGALSSSHNSGSVNFERIKGFLKSKETYLFPIVFICYNNSGLNSIALTTYLRDDLHYSPTKYNLYPSIIAILSMFVALFVGYLSDHFKGAKNYVFIASYFLCVGTGSFILSFFWDDIAVWFHILLYFVISVPSSYGQPQIFSWINRSLVHDDLKRHFIVVLTNTLPYLTSVVHIIVWDTRQQPRFKLGFMYNIFLSAVGIVATFFTLNYTRQRFLSSERSRYGSGSSFESIEEL
jgi:MFS family permease